MSRALTASTTLDTLKKDAKRWLKALRAGDGSARARLASVWPGAPAAPGLRDVQHALALEYGCAGWIALKAALEDLALSRRSREERLDIVLRNGWGGDAALARRTLIRHPELARDSLFAAAACGDLAEVERRLAADPDEAKRTGGPLQWSALAYVSYGRLDAVNAPAIARLLLAAGADPNFQFDDGWGSPFKILTGAIGLGEGAKPSHPQVQELTTLLIEAGASPYDMQALYNASIVGADTYWYEVLWRHCEARGLTDAWRDVSRSWPQFQANMLDYLLGNAVGQNHLARAQWLLQRGADANALHAYAKRPVLVVAQLSGFAEMAALLQGHGARTADLTPDEAFMAALRGGDATTVRAMAGADPALLAQPQFLLKAAEFGDAEAIQLLLALGASVDGVDDDGIGPLHRAVQSGSLESVDLLIAAGADINLRERKWHGTPMSWAIVIGQPHIAQRLAPLTTDVRALACQGMIVRLQAVLGAEPQRANEALPVADAPTPLFCLPEDEEAALEIARLLLAHGADAQHRNAKGQTPAAHARLHGLDDAADLLDAAPRG